MSTNNNFDKINLDAFDSSWVPELPSTSGALVEKVNDPKFAERIKSMLADYDDLTPELYDGYFAPYVGLNERSRVFEKHFPLLLAQIQMQYVGQLGSDTHVVQATLYLSTKDGSLPLFSRFGEGTSVNNRSDGAIAQAETSALRRIYCALGLGDNTSEEVAIINEQGQQKWIEGYLDEKKTAFDKLLKMYNAQASDHPIAEKENNKAMSLDQIKAGQLNSLCEYVKTLRGSKR
jgi:hypothetical protein